MPTGHSLSTDLINSAQAILEAVSDGSGTLWVLRSRAVAGTSEISGTVVNADGISQTGTGLYVISNHYLYGGSGTAWDRARGNVDETLFASTARAGTTESVLLTNYNARGVALFFDITTGSASGTIGTIVVQAEVSSGTYMPIYSLAPTGYTTGTAGFLVYPGAASAGNWTVAPIQGAIPRRWRVQVQPVTATATMTYQAKVSYIL